MCMGGDVNRDDANVNDAEIIGAIDLELRVNDTLLFPRQHRATANGVP